MSHFPRPARNAPAPPATAKPELDARRVLDVLCGRSTSAILQTLERGTLRSNELARTVPAASRTTLTQSLRRLESLGLLERRVFAEVPARVEYSLTPLSATPSLSRCRLWRSGHKNTRTLYRPCSTLPPTPTQRAPSWSRSRCYGGSMLRRFKAPSQVGTELLVFRFPIVGTRIVPRHCRSARANNSCVQGRRAWLEPS